MNFTHSPFKMLVPTAVFLNQVTLNARSIIHAFSKVFISGKNKCFSKHRHIVIHAQSEPHIGSTTNP